MKKGQNKKLENYMEGLQPLDYSELMAINGGECYWVWDSVKKKVYIIVGR